MRSSAVEFYYNGGSYWMNVAFNDNSGFAILSPCKYGSFTLNKDFESTRGIAWEFEKDFTKIFIFIDDEYDNIMHYKKIYKTNKNDSDLIEWFKKTPIYDIQNLTLDYFMKDII